MPVRSLSSSVLKWPDADTVAESLRLWAERMSQVRQDVLRVGYFGSYARGDWGVGSDLDVVIILKSSEQSFERRGLDLDTAELPVPVNMLVYTTDEWASFGPESRFYQTITREGIWVVDREKAS